MDNDTGINIILNNTDDTNNTNNNNETNTSLDDINPMFFIREYTYGDYGYGYGDYGYGDYGYGDYGSSGIMPTISSFQDILNNVILSNVVDNTMIRLAERLSSEEQELNRDESVDTSFISSIKYSDMLPSSKDDSQCFCTEDYVDDDDISLLDCKHYFHSKCIKEWMMYNKICPVCRTSIKK